jgi:UDP-galactopyranose mutase
VRSWQRNRGIGRLATFKYLDMDDAIAQVMTKLAPLTGAIPC